MEIITPTTFLNYPQKNNSIAFFMCYPRTFAGGNSILTQQNPFVFPIPLFILQLATIVVISRLIAMLIRPLRQPRYVSEILGGFILGPSVLGRSPKFKNLFFPVRSLIILDTLGQFGLIYSVFIMGIEAEKYITMKKATKVWCFTLACMVPTFALGSLASLAIHYRLHDSTNQMAFILFLGVTLSDSSFHSLVTTLSDLKLVHSEIGQLALASSMLSHNLLCAVLGYAFYLGQSNGDLLVSMWQSLAGIMFFFVSIAILKPIMHWVEKQIPEGADVDELCINMILVAVIVWGLLADVVGSPSVFGGLIIGLSIPNGPLSEALIETVANFNNGIFMPLFFLIVGMRINLEVIKNTAAVALLTMVIVLGVVFKVIVGAFVASMHKMAPAEGVSYGLMMNTRGLLEIINLSISISKRVLGDEAFTVVTILSIVMSAVGCSLIKALARPSKCIVSYKRRSIMWGNMDSELRFLTCAHVLRQVPGLISLLDLTHPTKRSPIFVYALHLIQLTGRTSIFLLNSTNEIASYFKGQSRGKKAESGQIFQAFHSYEQCASGVSVQCLTCITPYATMNDDVIYTAAERHAAIILLPFHKHASVDGTMALEHPAIRTVNQDVLDSAPCSVGILVDRGLSGHRNDSRRVTLFFVGGPDDREGLALVSRMAENPAIEVTVLRFLLDAKAHSPASQNTGLSKLERVVTMEGEDDDNLRDEDCITAFRERWRGGTVRYVEIGVSSAEETVDHIRGLGGEQELYVVGRGKGRESPMTAGMTQWSECPELGPIGDLLASPDFRTAASVLVLQQGGGVQSTPENHMDPQARFYREQVGVLRP